MQMIKGKSWLTPARAVVGLALMIFFAVCVFSINKPLTSDEAEFGAAARGVLFHGKPIYYIGDHPEAYLSSTDAWIFKATPMNQYQFGLWHSSIYIYLIAFSESIFCIHDFAARLPGALCLLLTLLLFYRLAKLCGDADGEGFSFAAVLLLCSPYILQMSLMVDFDNTVMSVGSLYFMYRYLHARGQYGIRPVVALSLITCLAFWTKEYAPVYLFSAVFVFEILNRNWRALGQALIAGAVGSSLFFLSWLTYCRIFDFPIDYFLHFSFTRRLQAGAGLFTDYLAVGGWDAAFSAVRKTFLYSAAWSSIFLFVFMVLLGALRMRQYLEKRKCDSVDLLLLYSVIVLIATKFVRPSTASLKYEFPAYPPLILVLGIYLRDSLSQMTWKKIALTIPLLLALVAVVVSVTGDPVLGILRSHVAAEKIWWFGGISVGLVFCVCAAFYFRTRELNQTALVYSLLIAMLANHLALDWQQTASYLTPASLLENYGESGFSQAVEAAKPAAIAGQRISVRKDIGFRLSVDLDNPDLKWLEPAILLKAAEMGESQFAESIGLNRPSAVQMIVTDRYGLRRVLVERLRATYSVDKKVGDFFVVKNKPQSPQQTE